LTAEDVQSAMTMAGQNLNSSVDYKLTARDVLSNALTLNHRSSGENSMNGFRLSNASGTTLDQYDRPRDDDAKGWMADYNMALKRTFEPRKHELSGEWRANYAHDQDDLTLW